VGACKVQRGQGDVAELEVGDETALGAEPGTGSRPACSSNLGSSALVWRIVI